MIYFILLVYWGNTGQLINQADYDLHIFSLTTDNSRFIAHAGGIINGHKYTNSLEALNYSYKKGFKLFELDILKTSDNHFVAAHDWKLWQEATKYQGIIPPTKEEFMMHKLYDIYTPLDIDSINHWFTEHKDAILVTDKTNDPLGFSKLFIDKKRLKMELFSWRAVKKGQQINIGSAMPNGNLLHNIKGSKIDFLKINKIKEIVVSRKFILKNKELLRKITRSGIHVFAYHINSNNGLGEKTVICFENEFLYGIYADHWSFDEVVNCDTLRN